MRFFLYTSLLFITFRLSAQDSINFQRIDFSSGVVGDTASFVLQADSSLWMNASSDTNKVYLAKSSTCDFGTSWKIRARMNVNPSNYNNIKFYVLSDFSCLPKAANAYYVVIGNNADEVSLYSQTAKSSTKVIDGLDKRIDKDTLDVEVIVSLDTDGNFSLWSKRADESAYYEEGTASIKSSYSETSFVGFLCTYSSKNAEKFYIDEVGIACPSGDGGSDEGDGSDDGSDTTSVSIEEDHFTLSARSFANGGEAVYVQYKFPEAGYVARIVTFDSRGNRIEELANNTVLEKEGRIQLTADYPHGIIIVFAEARTTNGTFIRKKIPIVCGE